MNDPTLIGDLIPEARDEFKCSNLLNFILGKLVKWLGKGTPRHRFPKIKILERKI